MATWGTVLELVGVVIAGAGGWLLHRELVGRVGDGLLRDLSAGRGVTAALARRTWDRMRGRKSVNVAAGAVVLSGAAYGARGTVTRPALPSDPDAQAAHLQRMIDALFTLHDEHVERTRAEHDLIRADMVELGDRVGADVTEVRQNLEAFREAMTGRDGRGLRVALLGVAVTLAGQVLSIIGA